MNLGKGSRRYGFVVSAVSAVLALVLMLPLVTARAGSVPPVVRQAYFDAVDDASKATQDKVAENLLAIVPGDDDVNRTRLHGCKIVWEGKPGSSRVLVAAFMSRDSYDKYYRENLENKEPAYILKKSLWVTVVPELQNYFVGKGKYKAAGAAADTCPPTPARLVRLLGLNPGMSYEILLEMWIDPSALFRPSADPEATDHEGQIARKNSTGDWVFPAEGTPFIKFDDTQLYMETSKSICPTCTQWTYRDWFVNRIGYIYKKGNVDDPSTWGYPWTRLGYTYDWGNKKNHVGASEFVIRLDPSKQDATVTVKLHRAVDSAKPEWKKYFRCKAGCTDEGNLSAVKLVDELEWRLSTLQNSGIPTALP